MKVKTLILGILACGLGGCYNLQFQRGGPVDVSIPSPKRPAVSPLAAEKHAQTQTIGVIEFDDMGELWNRCDLSLGDKQPCQWTATRDWIKQERKNATALGRSSVVIVFVHGWNHNAQNGDPNLVDFARTIQSLQDSNKQLVNVCGSGQFAETDKSVTCPPTPKPLHYIGVYLGWRGRTFPGGANYLTPLGREKGAKRVASVSATEVVLRLRKVSKRSDLGQGGKFMLIGHSFGGLLVERTVAQTLTGEIASENESKSCSDDPQSGVTSTENSSDSHSVAAQMSIADLVVLINPAIEALETQELIDMMKRSRFCTPWIKDPNSNNKFRAPLLISIKARNDNATGSLFRVGHTLEQVDKAFRGYPDGATLSVPGEKSPTQRIVFASTVGYLAFYHNYCYVDDQGSHDDRDPVCNKVIDDIMSARTPLTPAPSAKLEDLQFTQSLPRCTPDGKHCQVFTWIPPMASDSRRLLHIYTRYDPKDCSYSGCAVWNNTPYWIFTVPPKIINGHNDIWEPRFINLLTDLVQAATQDQQQP
jgi:hypothetical protein